MSEAIDASLAGLPNFLAYFGMAILLSGAFVLIYVRLTPQREFALIKANKSAAAVAFSGSLIGFALPLSSAIAHSVSVPDCAVWGTVALLVQALTFIGLRLGIDRLPERIAQDELATGILVAAVSISVGLLNAASMTY